MHDLEIKKFNDSVLRKKAEQIGDIGPDIKELVLNMAEIMRDNQGVGLAGPQVGVSKRVIVIQPDLRSSKVIALINPEIIEKSKETETDEEGCLSFPGIFLKVERAEEIEVKALNIDGKEIKIRARGFLARVLQHEIDHLNGTLFFNRLSFLNKIKFKLKHPKVKI